MYCQKCRASLRFDSTLEDLNPAAYDLLIGAASQQVKHIPPSRSPYPQGRKELFERAVKNTVNSNNFLSTASRTLPIVPDGAQTGSGNSAMSFVMLSGSQVESSTERSHKKTGLDSETMQDLDLSDGEAKAISQDMNRMSRLFEILTARSDIDFPVCVECTDLLINGLQRRLEAAIKERDAYVGFLKQVNSEIPTSDEVQESQEALAIAQKDEEAALETLKKLEEEKVFVDAEVAALEEEARALDIEEEKFWRERNDFAMKLAEFQSIRDSINLKYDHDSQVLDKLQRTNVYNDTFCISHDGNFGTINGLRLGRLSNIPVDWSEINAAWGHTVLLLQTLADRLGFKFQGYQLQPMGSTSRILRFEKISTSNSRNTSRAPKKTVLELFSSGDMPLGLTFMHRHFDTAMVAFLECMRQLGAFVEAKTTHENSTTSKSVHKLPYKIEGDKIGDASIKLGIAQDDAWSRACKYTLTCCKFLLAHASNVNTMANDRRTL